jgi:hypothetical protein
MIRKLRDAFPSELHRDAFQQLTPDWNRDAFETQKSTSEIATMEGILSNEPIKYPSM